MREGDANRYGQVGKPDGGGYETPSRLTEIARRKRRGLSPSRQAGSHGSSPCFSASGMVHLFYRQFHLGALSGRPDQQTVPLLVEWFGGDTAVA